MKNIFIIQAKLGLVSIILIDEMKKYLYYSGKVGTFKSPLTLNRYKRKQYQNNKFAKAMMYLVNSS